MHSRIVCSALVASLALARAAAAEEPPATERAMAESLFRDAKKLLARGKAPEACAKLAESYHLDPAGGTLINLAMCHEIEGKTATAWTEFNEARAAARKARRADRERAASDHMRALEPRMSRVTVSVPAVSVAPGMRVTLDGVEIATGVLGTPISVDPGDHVIAASAPDRQAWELKLSFKEGESKPLVVPSLAPKAPPPPPPPPPAPWKRPVGIVAVSAGAVLLGVGAGFGAHAISLGSTAAAGCPQHVCSPRGWQALQDGRSAANVADGTLAAGGALAAAGTIILILSAIPGPESRSARVVPVIGPGLAMIGAGGVF